MQQGEVMSGCEEDKAIKKLVQDFTIDTGVKLASGLPIIGPAIESIKGLAENTKNLYDAINKQKLYDFYMGIYSLDEDIEKYLKHENIAFVVKKLIQDDDSRKTEYYSKLIVNISNSNHSIEERIYFITTLSKISVLDIDNLIKIVFDNEISNYRTMFKYKLYNSINTLDRASYNNLLNCGLLQEENVVDGPRINATSLSKSFATLLY